jgi:DNA-binding MarR family transcriptional regulator
MNHENKSIERSSELFRSFWRVNHSMRQFIHKTAMANDLSIPQYALLMTLAPKREMTQKQLGNKTHFPKSTLSQAVDGLVQLELITRHPVEENRREMQLTLSEKGKLLYETMRLQEGSIYLALESAIDTLTEKQYDEVLSVQLQIAIVLEKEAKEQGECSK